jgi:hypothetical protein
MAIVNLTAWDAGEPLQPDLARSLLSDFECGVGHVSRSSDAHAGAKGIAIDLTTFAVALVSSHAMAALVELLRSWLARHRDFEFEVECDGRRLRLKGDQARRMSEGEIAALVERIMAEASPAREDHDASRRHRRR